MGCRVEAVDEPALGPDGGADAEGEVLGELEGLEVVEDDGLVELAAQLFEAMGVDHVGHHDLGVAVLARMEIEEEVDQCALEASHRTGEDGEPGARDLGRALEVEPDPYSLMILDLMLPGAYGLDVLKHLRSDCDIPVLVLSARNDTSDKVRALQLGADDFVTKPFWPDEA